MAVRLLSRTEHPSTILLWFPLGTVPFSLVATLVLGRAALPRNALEVLGHLLVTATALVGQIALTHGLARVRAAPATAVTLSGPVFGVFYGVLLFGNLPAPASLAGIALTISALALLARSRAVP